MITRLAATNNGDLYMLNQTDGTILHARFSGDGGRGSYQLDENFHCEPGQYGEFIVSDLVDMALLPKDSDNPNEWALAAIDINGNIIYCSRDERPVQQVLTPPDSQWGKPAAISVKNGNLYMLDPVTNAVWIFEGEEYSFVGTPRFFFGAEVPSLRLMLDLDVDNDTLYLINQDGYAAVCEYSEDFDDPTTCEDPVTYGDARPGRNDSTIFADALFSQIHITEAPLASVYLLDPVARSLYQFNLGMDLQRQFRALNELPEGLVTAFTVSPQQSIFLAVGNQVFFGFIPTDS
jgi:hypothetical protein